jgi:hypothetical protein
MSLLNFNFGMGNTPQGGKTPQYIIHPFAASLLCDLPVKEILPFGKYPLS